MKLSVIEKNVPPPREPVFPLRQMAVHDSFVVYLEAGDVIDAIRLGLQMEVQKIRELGMYDFDVSMGEMITEPGASAYLGSFRVRRTA